MSYVERKRKDPLTAMEVGNHECDKCDTIWGGDENEYQYYDSDDCYYEVNYSGYGTKGKGKSWGPKGKGKGPYKGAGKGAPFHKGGGKDRGRAKARRAVSRANAIGADNGATLPAAALTRISKWSGSGERARARAS